MEAVVGQAVERELDPNELRGSVLNTYMPIHSYIFDVNGDLLFSNMRATDKIRRAGAGCILKMGQSADIHFSLACTCVSAWLLCNCHPSV